MLVLKNQCIVRAGSSLHNTRGILKYSFHLVAIMAFALLSSSCTSQADEVKTRLGEEFSLRIGQTASIEEENLEIRFCEVVEDSRCPKNVTCVWAGRVSCIVGVSDSGSSYKMVLTEPGLSDQYAKETYKEYRLAFHVDPYPEAGKKISEDEYRLLLIVSK